MKETIPLKQSKIIKVIKSEHIPLAIAVMPQGSLIILDKEHCRFLDYKDDQIVRRCSIALRPSEIAVNKIYVHPRKDIVVIPNYSGRQCILFEGIDKKTKLRYGLKNEISNIIFDDYEDDRCALKDGFFAFKNKSLIYHADSTTLELRLQVSPLFYLK